MTGSTDKSRNRKLKILKVAQELFNSDGFQETTVDDIMRGVGAAKGAFYYYFDTKEQVLDCLIDNSINKKVSAVSSVLEKPGMNALQKLQIILQEEFKTGMESYDPKNHVHNIKNVDMHQKIIAGMVERFAPLIGKVVEQGINEGRFRTEYPLEVSQIVVAGVHFVTDLGIFKWSAEQYLSRIKASEELIEKVLCIQKGSLSILPGSGKNLVLFNKEVGSNGNTNNE